MGRTGRMSHMCKGNAHRMSHVSCMNQCVVWVDKLTSKILIVPNEMTLVRTSLPMDTNCHPYMVRYNKYHNSIIFLNYIPQ